MSIERHVDNEIDDDKDDENDDDNQLVEIGANRYWVYFLSTLVLLDVPILHQF